MCGSAGSAKRRSVPSRWSNVRLDRCCRGQPITGGTGGRARWWDLATGKPLGPWWPTAGLVRGARFLSEDGVFIADTTHASGELNTVARSAAVAESLPALRSWVHRTSGKRVSKGVAEVVPLPALVPLPAGEIAAEKAVAT